MLRPADIVKGLLVMLPGLDSSIVTYGNIYVVLRKRHQPRYAWSYGAEWQVALQRHNGAPYKHPKIVGYGHLVPYLGFFNFMEGIWDTSTRKRTA